MNQKRSLLLNIFYILILTVRADIRSYTEPHQRPIWLVSSNLIDFDDESSPFKQTIILNSQDYENQNYLYGSDQYLENNLQNDQPITDKIIKPSVQRYKKCGRLDECKGRDESLKKPPLYKDKDFWIKAKCFCDEDCHIYGDCCIDKSMSDLSYRMDNHLSNWGCVHVAKDKGVYGIVGCSGKLAELCSKSKRLDNLLSDVVVYSTTTGIVYANVYCAICHGVLSSDIAYTNITTACHHNTTQEKLAMMEYDNLSYGSKKNCTNGTKMTCISTECELQLSGLPPNSRLCNPSIDKCPREQTNSGEEECNAYSLLVMDVTTRMTYKNPHCALCHGVDIKSLRCYNQIGGKFQSLSIIMDFDWGFENCKLPSTVWDSQLNTCVSINCLDRDCSIVIPEYSLEDSYEYEIEGYITSCILVLSITLLLIHNFMYYLESKRQNVPSQILKSLSWCLIFGHISFLLIDIKESSAPTVCCKIIGMATQFFYTASFFWMNVMSFDVWRTFSRVNLRGSSSTIFFRYSCYCWSCSTIIVLITTISDYTTYLPEHFRPNIGLNNICWFGNKISLGIFYVLPIFIILLLNLYLFCKTVTWFQKQTSKEFERVNNEAIGRKEYNKAWLYIKLSIIMGLTWMFSIISTLTNSPNLLYIHIITKYIFIIFSGLQGAFIFIMFDMKRKTLYRVFDRFKYWRNSSSQSDVKPFQTKETTLTHLSRNNTSLSLKANTPQKLIDKINFE